MDKIQVFAYIAGLIDGDGSIMLQLRPRKEMRFLFRVKTVVVIYQDAAYIDQLKEIQRYIASGYIYKRNDRIAELRIEGHKAVEQLLVQLQPHIRFKSRQVKTMLTAIQILKRTPYLVEDFLTVCMLSDRISRYNYSSKKRKYTYEYVQHELEKASIIPVTT